MPPTKRRETPGVQYSQGGGLTVIIRQICPWETIVVPSPECSIRLGPLRVPVIRQRENQLEAIFFSGLDNLV
jgi:hypothetical protein